MMKMTQQEPIQPIEDAWKAKVENPKEQEVQAT